MLYHVLISRGVFFPATHKIMIYLKTDGVGWLSLCVNLPGPGGAQILGQTSFWVLSVRVFLGEGNIRTGRSSKVDCFP